jgi:hypothetical protein
MRTASTSLLILALGCSASSSPTAPPDGGADGTTEDAASEGACFPLCSSSGSSGGGSSGGSDAAGDGPKSCAALSNEITSLQGPAQECNPQIPGQCTGTTPGPCCAITVNAGNDTNVNAYETVVQQYTSQCMPMCMGMCPTVPSEHCVSSGTSMGICQ